MLYPAHAVLSNGFWPAFTVKMLKVMLVLTGLRIKSTNNIPILEDRLMLVSLTFKVRTEIINHARYSIPAQLANLLSKLIYLMDGLLLWISFDSHLYLDCI